MVAPSAIDTERNKLMKKQNAILEAMNMNLVDVAKSLRTLAKRSEGEFDLNEIRFLGDPILKADYNLDKDD